MASILKVSEWESSTGRTNVADTTTYTPWWRIPRFLGISLTDYVLLLKNEYHASHFVYYPEKELLLFSWDKTNKAYAHKFMLYINRMARNGNWQVEKWK